MPTHMLPGAAAPMAPGTMSAYFDQIEVRCDFCLNTPLLYLFRTTNVRLLFLDTKTRTGLCSVPCNLSRRLCYFQSLPYRALAGSPPADNNNRITMEQKNNKNEKIIMINNNKHHTINNDTNPSFLATKRIVVWSPGRRRRRRRHLFLGGARGGAGGGSEREKRESARMFCKHIRAKTEGGRGWAPSGVTTTLLLTRGGINISHPCLLADGKGPFSLPSKHSWVTLHGWARGVSEFGRGGDVVIIRDT